MCGCVCDWSVGLGEWVVLATVCYFDVWGRVWSLVVWEVGFCGFGVCVVRL